MLLSKGKWKIWVMILDLTAAGYNWLKIITEKAPLNGQDKNVANQSPLNKMQNKNKWTFFRKWVQIYSVEARFKISNRRYRSKQSNYITNPPKIETYKAFKLSHHNRIIWKKRDLAAKMKANSSRRLLPPCWLMVSA